MAEKEKVFHIRRNQNDQGLVPLEGPSPTMSPDIICYQNSLFTYTDAVNSYSNYVCKHFLQGTANLIYVRGRNNTDIAQNGEVKAYYSPLTLLYLPDKWIPMESQTTGKYVVELRQAMHEKAEAGAIVLCSEAFLLYDVENPKLHHCMLAISRQKGEEWLKLPPSFTGDKGLWDFLREHANIAYNNIVIETGFLNQHSEVVMVGNHNSYDESYAVRFSLVSRDQYKNDTFGGCNIGRIQLLSTDIDSPFDFNVYPEADDEMVVSPAFRLPAGCQKSILITYFAADPTKKVYGTIVHDYITCNSQGSIPARNDSHRMLKTTNHLGKEIQVNTDAKLGDYTIVFTDDEEDSLQTLKRYNNETDRIF